MKSWRTPPAAALHEIRNSASLTFALRCAIGFLIFDQLLFIPSFLSLSLSCDYLSIHHLAARTTAIASRYLSRSVRINNEILERYFPTTSFTIFITVKPERFLSLSLNSINFPNGTFLIKPNAISIFLFLLILKFPAFQISLKKKRRLLENRPRDSWKIKKENTRYFD